MRKHLDLGRWSSENHVDKTSARRSLANAARFGVQIRFEIDSIYIFSTILLNRIANFYATWLRPRDISCESHRQLWTGINKSRASFPFVSDDLLMRATWLTNSVIEHRAKFIAHTMGTAHINNFTAKTLSIDSGAGARISIRRADAPDMKHETKPLELIAFGLASYMEGIISVYALKIDESPLVRLPRK